jgi:hypothetical protein
MSRLRIRFNTHLKGGGVITFVGDRAYQAVHWETLAYDVFTDAYWPPIGTLGQERTKTGKSFLSTNTYLAPTRQPKIRWGTGYRWGEKIWAEDWIVNDHIRVKWNN